MLAKRYDTLYILTDESKESWQFSSKEFKLVKLKRTRPQDMPDLSPKGFEDARARIDFGNFTFKNDTLTVTLALYQQRDFRIYDYKLFFDRGEWKITSIKSRW